MSTTPMSLQDACRILKSNKPSHGYTMLREAIETILAVLTPAQQLDEAVERKAAFNYRQSLPDSDRVKMGYSGEVAIFDAGWLAAKRHDRERVAGG